MLRKFLVRGTRGGIPFEITGIGEGEGAAVNDVKSRLLESYPRQEIEIKGVTPITHVKESVGFRESND